MSILTWFFFAGGCPGAQLDDAFGLLERYQGSRFHLLPVADCSLPLPATPPPPASAYTVGGVTVRVGSYIRLSAKDRRGIPWSTELDIRQGGCWLWHADLDHNGTEDFISVTSDATSGGESILTFVMIDGSGRPVPWYAVGLFEPEDDALTNLTDLDHDGRAELLYVSVEPSRADRSGVISLARYLIRDAHLEKVDGAFAGEDFPIVVPSGAKLGAEPDFTNVVSSGSHPVTITSLQSGTRQDCGGVQLPLVHGQGDAVSVDNNAAEDRARHCADNLVLSDGRRVAIPQMVVLDRGGGRELALAEFGSVLPLLAKAQKERIRIGLAGSVCEEQCRPFLLWASETAR